jgi:hypothetical protein
MSGFGILATLIAVTTALVVGVPLVLAGTAILVAFAGVSVALGLAGGLLWLVFRCAFAIGGVLVFLLSGGLMIVIAGAIASHLLPVLFLGFLVWLVVRATRPSARPPQAIAAV